jgi:S1-C subfamily serine protease
MSDVPKPQPKPTTADCVRPYPKAHGCVGIDVEMVGDKSPTERFYPPDLNLVSIYQSVSNSVRRIWGESCFGSGFNINGKYELLTDEHVIDNKNETKVRSKDGKMPYPKIEVLAEDKSKDVLYLRYAGEKITPVPMCIDDSKGAFDQKLYGIGFPNGAVRPVIAPSEPLILENSNLLARGIAFFSNPTSAKATPKQSETTTLKAAIDRYPKIQVDPLIKAQNQQRTVVRLNMHTEPGFSGGPVVNGKGCAVGMLDASASNGDTYVTPIKDVIASLKPSK